jgi:parallel beta-helix repeat protein
MTRQVVPVSQRKNSRYIRPLPAGLIALLLLSGGSILLSAKAGIAPTLTAQAAASGTVIYVNPASGTDKTGAGTSEAAAAKSISFALSQAKPGTTIQVAPGSYSQENGEKFPLIIPGGVTLRGDEANKGQGVLINGGGGYTSRTFAKQDVAIFADKDSTVAGVTVTNPSQRGTGVWVESSNPNIKNNTFANSGRDGVFVTALTAANPKIEGNVFLQNKGNGISIAKSSQGEIRNNVFQDTGFGMAIGGTSTPTVEGNQILQNQDGIFISDSAKPILRKNVIQDNKRDGIIAITNALPDLGTNESPGGNLIRNNKRYDLNNFTKTNKIIAIGNDIDSKKISGQVDFVAGVVEPPPGGGGVATAFKDVPAGYWAKVLLLASLMALLSPTNQ